ncbi:FG-GAP-like repeat-containing protein [Caulobacter sp. UNC279MFTsu5.1]|uniref:FG-GAP-like repeat-containing protein n=1 Tax=Caulobacter sp. UNC279MFTsu5.1 TaxID=1502775 RepID=UPI000382089B|nr:FG-GAP-like repeat-containing protein [Caulobacter sp. UNC279MFTsu5.1]
MPENVTGTSGPDTINTTETTQTVQTFGGDDQVWVWVSNGDVQMIDTGEGDDYVAIQLPYNAAPTEITLTLGGGRDKIEAFQLQKPVVVTDFTPGASGDVVDFRYTLDQWVNGWNGHGNPFQAGGYFRLVQVGADTILQIDKHNFGQAGTWTDWMVFKNTVATSFTAENFGGVAPDGSAPPNLVVQGSAGDDVLHDGYGDDWMYGGAGDDNLSAGMGDDKLDGGDGNDWLQDDYGGADRLLGGAGDDILQVTANSTTNGPAGREAYIDGGSGNDRLYYQTRNDTGATAVALGGAGDDVISIHGAATTTVDAGAGADRVFITRSGAWTVTLGEGRDVVQAYMPKDTQVTAGTHIIHITDFQAGSAGDRLDMQSYVDFTGWNGQSDLVAGGYISIVQSGADTVIKLATNGGTSWNTTIVLDNIQLASLNPFNLGGLGPNGMYGGLVKFFPTGGSFAGGDAADLLTGYLNSVTFSGGDGGDRLEGGDGNDTLNGDAGDDFLFGGRSSDLLYGGTGADRLLGETGADHLHGGAGGDILIGGQGSDLLEGGAGADLFEGALADLAGDAILDFERGDVLKITNVDPAHFSFDRHGAVLTFSTGATLVLANNPHGSLIAADGGSGSILLMLADSPKAQIVAPFNADFDGDGRSDLAWREAGGLFTTWRSALNHGGLAMTPNQYVTSTIDIDQRLAAAADFTGDGKSDLLWRDADGAFSVWISGGVGFQRLLADASVTNDWGLAATGDFNGDGKADLIWRHVSGTFSEWTSKPTSPGDFTRNVYVNGGVDASWALQSAGDFNGDGKDDLIWRNPAGVFTLWQSTGTGFAANTLVDDSVSADWSVAAIGDFNGDGKDDLIWRHETGVVSEWRSTGHGFDKNVYVNGGVGVDWTLESTGDFNGDGKADLMWRHDGGTFTVWQSTGDSFAVNALIDGTVSSNWSLASSDYLLS